MARDMQTFAPPKTPQQKVTKMQHRWNIAFVASLLLVIGYAAGFIGAAFAIAVFSVALFLQWANTSGFAGARKRVALDQFTMPFWKADNWRQLAVIVDDRVQFERAVTCAVVSVALLLIVPAYFALGTVVVVAGWYAFQIYGSYSAISGRTPSPASNPEL